MYEYKCSNINCGQIWTIDEGDIGPLYLTCPNCNKGKGVFLRQIKTKPEFEQFMKKKPDISEKVDKTEVESPKQVSMLGIEEKPEKENTTQIEDSTLGNNQAEKVLDNQVDIKQIEKNIKDNDSDNIFNRIINKRKLEEEFTKDSNEDVEILEISGNSEEEIERRIKEFEEYYYIKVIDKNIVKQGNRYNCIMKYYKK